ncbi:hypothetical protein ACS0TY_005102 [Phlomoides rotata]
MEKEEEEEEAAAVAAFVRKEVEEWDDEAKSRARFKALSGQRSDWEPLYCFWRDLILKTCRHLRIFLIRPSRLRRLWFRRHGLSPLCLDRVLLEMHRAGDLLPPHPTPTLSHIFRRALDFLGATNDAHLPLTEDLYILAPLLEERALEVVNQLSENYWTPSCVVTMRKFEDICMGSKEASAILNYLSAQGRARLLVINRADPIEGVKVYLDPGAAASTASSTDHSVLHLTWTAEKLEQQLDLIEQRYHKSRNLALVSLKCGNKIVALRHTKELKLASQSRERCTALLNRVEQVLQVIADAESSKKVSEALQSSTHAIKENQISIAEVDQCLQELDENFASLKQLDSALEATTTTAYAEIDDEDLEEDFNSLHLEIKSEENQVPTDDLSNAFSNLHLKDEKTMNSVAECCVDDQRTRTSSKEANLEAA